MLMSGGSWMCVFVGMTGLKKAATETLAEKIQNNSDNCTGLFVRLQPRWRRLRFTQALAMQEALLGLAQKAYSPLAQKAACYLGGCRLHPIQPGAVPRCRNRLEAAGMGGHPGHGGLGDTGTVLVQDKVEVMR